MSCCGCLEIPARITNLFKSPELLNKFTGLTGINIFSNLFICDLCTLKLESAHSFKEKCLEIYEQNLISEEDHSKQIFVEDELIVYEESPGIEFIDDPLVKVEEFINENDEEEAEEFHLDQSEKIRYRNTYEPEIKLKAIENAEATSNRQAGKEMSIDESCIRKWRTQKKQLEKKKSKNSPNIIKNTLIQSSAEQQLSLSVENSEKKVVKSRKSYTSGQKLEVVNYAEVTGNRQASRAFSIDESCIRKWRMQKDLLIEINRERGTKRKPNLHWSELDKELKEWVFEKMNNGILLKPREIKAESIEIAKNLNIDNFRGTSSYIFKFMERYHIPKRSEKLKINKIL